MIDTDTVTPGIEHTLERADAVLRETFHFPAWRPGQRAVVEALLRDNAALAVFPTGGGKSLCYQVPALLLEGVTLVVSPLIALMKDQIDALTHLSVPAARLDSSIGAAESRTVTANLRNGSLRLLYVAPERFNNERFLRLLEGMRIALFAVDEAHCISEWGHNFRPDYLKLAEHARSVGAERVLALTATATPAVVHDVCAGFGIPRRAAVVTGFYRPNLFLRTTPVPAAGRDRLLAERLRSAPPGSTIVYVTLQKTAERVAARLADGGLPARAYHAGMDADARAAVQEWWSASDRGIVVATIAFGMGIDKADVRAVYHYNLPKSLESYSQEMGRAGRDDLPSIVELLAAPDDVPTLENFAYGDTPTESALQSLLDEVLGGPCDEFDVSLYDLARRHDIRELVLRTALTYLELDGVLRQGTPFYAGYEVRPGVPLDALLARFDPRRAAFVRGIFASARKGRTWYAVLPEAVAEALGEPRARVVAALDYLAEAGLAEVRASEPRQRYTRLRPAEGMGDEAPQGEEPPSPGKSLASGEVASLAARFERRERQEIARIQQVLDLVAHAGCQTNALVGYFGEQRAEPCGHCTFCETGEARVLPPRAPLPAPGEVVDPGALAALVAQHTAALGEARQQARFLCGLASPAVAQVRIGRHPLFGALEAHRFADVLAWCQSLAVRHS